MKIKTQLLIAGVVAAFLGATHEGLASKALAPGPSAEAPARSLKPSGTTNFSSKVAGFSVHFPGKVFQTRKITASPHGQYQQMLHRSFKSPVRYGVFVVTTPNNEKGEVSEMLAVLKQGILRNTKSTTDWSCALTLNGVRGLEFHVSRSRDTMESHVYIFATPTRTYQVTAYGTRQGLRARRMDVKRFFASFRFIGS